MMAYPTSDTFIIDLHTAAKKGKKQIVKEIVQSGINVDYPNFEGQSALFCACSEDHEAVAKILLKARADPNERSNEGLTPVHMASYNGNIRLLLNLIKAGGDLRLHDRDGLSVRDWAVVNCDVKKRKKMVKFLEKSKLFALRKSNSNTNTANPNISAQSIIVAVRKKVGLELEIAWDPLKRVQSIGFGSVYTCGDGEESIVSAIPVDTGRTLVHDPKGLTFHNGSFLLMESMTWIETPVTVKSLHVEVNEDRAYVDVLINEMDHLGKLRHPNILLLMGVCQKNSLDNIVLVFERVTLGSLNYYMHSTVNKLENEHISTILIQVCDALKFLHNRGYIHCNLSSHAVNLVSPTHAKIGNLEHMMNTSKADLGKRTAVSLVTSENTIYNWMAPELMQQFAPSYCCDVYSFSCIMWEMFQCEIPWDKCDAKFIKHKLLVEKQQLRTRSSLLPPMFKSIAAIGLLLDPFYRDINFEDIYVWLQGNPNEAISRVKKEISEKSPRKPPRQTSSSNSRNSRSSSISQTRLQNLNQFVQEGIQAASRVTIMDGEVEQEQSADLEVKRSRKSKPDITSEIKYGHTKKCIPFTVDKRNWTYDIEEKLDANTYSYLTKLHQEKTINEDAELQPLDDRDCYSCPDDFHDCNDEDIGDMFSKGFAFPVLKHETSTASNVVNQSSGMPRTNLRSEKSSKISFNTCMSSPVSQNTLNTSTESDKTRRVSSDPRWFGGKGSVKNLVHLFQAHANQHELQQQVLEQRKSNTDLAQRNDFLAGWSRGIEKEIDCLYGESRPAAVEDADREDAYLTHGFNGYVLDSGGYSNPEPVYYGQEDDDLQIAERASDYLLDVGYSDAHWEDNGFRPVGDYVPQCSVSQARKSNHVLEEEHPRPVTDVGQSNSESACSEQSGTTGVQSISSADSGLLTTWISNQLDRAKSNVALEQVYPELDPSEGSLLDEIVDEISKSQQQPSQFYPRDVYDESRLSRDIAAERYDLGHMMNFQDVRQTFQSNEDSTAFGDAPSPQRKYSKQKFERSAPMPTMYDQSAEATYAEAPVTRGFTTTVTVESSLLHPCDNEIHFVTTTTTTAEQTTG